LNLDLRYDLTVIVLDCEELKIDGAHLFGILEVTSHLEEVIKARVDELTIKDEDIIAEFYTQSTVIW
jgi:hypothetical protein